MATRYLAVILQYDSSFILRLPLRSLSIKIFKASAIPNIIIHPKSVIQTHIKEIKSLLITVESLNMRFTHTLLPKILSLQIVVYIQISDFRHQTLKRAKRQFTLGQMVFVARCYESTSHQKIKI